jgi:hypothetical protein
MCDFVNSTFNPRELASLYVCNTCGRIYGEVSPAVSGSVSPPRQQRCECESAEFDPPWEGYDFPEAVTLCRCCGRRALLGGRPWSIWFCIACRRGVERINRLGRCHFIPVGRHTLLDQIGRDADEEEIPAFVAGLGDWFARLERLELHAWLVMQSNLRALSRDAQTELRLADYLERLPATTDYIRAAIRDLGRAFDLPPFILAEATVDIP